MKRFIQNLLRWLRKDLSKEQEKHRKLIKEYSKNAYNIQSHIVRFTPINFEKSAVRITKELMEHKGILVDFSNMSNHDAQRLMDFISGLIFCLGGTGDCLGRKLYIFTPSSVNIKDATTELTRPSLTEETFGKTKKLKNNIDFAEEETKELKDDF